MKVDGVLCKCPCAVLLSSSTRESDNLPQFGKREDIVMIDGQVNLLVGELTTVSFSEHWNSFLVLCKLHHRRFIPVDFYHILSPCTLEMSLVLRQLVKWPLCPSVVLWCSCIIISFCNLNSVSLCVCILLTIQLCVTVKISIILLLCMI